MFYWGSMKDSWRCWSVKGEVYSSQRVEVVCAGLDATVAVAEVICKGGKTMENGRMILYDI